MTHYSEAMLRDRACLKTIHPSFNMVSNIQPKLFVAICVLIRSTNGLVHSAVYCQLAVRIYEDKEWRMVCGSCPEVALLNTNLTKLECMQECLALSEVAKVCSTQKSRKPAANPLSILLLSF
jgi:hypothetical protein